VQADGFHADKYRQGVAEDHFDSTVLSANLTEWMEIVISLLWR
jgi:hypothetical protein